MPIQEGSPGDGNVLMRLVRAERDAQQRDRVVAVVRPGDALGVLVRAHHSSTASSRM